MKSSDIAIVIEWENTKLAGDSRAFRMLCALFDQVLKLKSRTIEIIIVYDVEQMTELEVGKIINKTVESNERFSFIKIRLCGSTGLTHYKAKNFGAQIAQSDIVLFLDSDVIPESNWLYHITEPFWAQTHVSVLCSSVYIDPSSIVGKAFYFGWFFPQMNESTALESVHFFFANSVAFRSELFSRYEFPDMPEGVTRGSCSMLANNLIQDGFVIYKNNLARVAHPAPSGLLHFLVRSLAEGRDNANTFSSDKINFLKDVAYRFVYSIKRCAANLNKTQAHVKVSRVESVILLSIMTCYYFLASIGSLIALIFPKYAAKSWRI